MNISYKKTTGETISETEIVAQLRSGDERGLSVLYNHYYPVCIRFAKRQYNGLRASEIEDCFSDAFFKTYKHYTLPKKEPYGAKPFGNLLMTIFKRNMIKTSDQNRRMQRIQGNDCLKNQSDDTNMDSFISALREHIEDQIPAIAIWEDKHMMENKKYNAYLKAFEEINDNHKLLLKSKYYECLKYQDIFDKYPNLYASVDVMKNTVVAIKRNLRQRVEVLISKLDNKLI